MNEPSGTSAPVPLRFTLGQLLLWILATCIVLAHEKWRLSSVGSERSVFLLYANIHTFIHAPLRGACLAAFILCAWRRLTGGARFPIEPGHWLLFIRGVEDVLYGVSELINTLIGPEDLQNYLPNWFVYSERFIFDGPLIILMVLAAVRTASNRWWPAAFIAMVVCLLSHWLHSALVDAFTSGVWFMHELSWSIVSRLLYSLPAAFAVLGTVADCKARRSHDFIHWLGIGVTVIQAAVEWPIYATWWYLFRILKAE
jgi:hypothetical protein